ncbi:HpcH/HpaI aldolase/citrate lyase family protein [Sedimenticola selenatireducens]|uniref:CoA ester lyase n=1 Tax=Sedimenticola selenatireducens TaxID=191960 RepID=A0A557SH14_9GAMM|nr:CoA ester lyase [Sedimenticola selenatireducens]TVO76718.1 CoA ester lyase [Sedimenticola selenatireducens]TVT64161.1 MAG: CoA ester lyase [Sedimenticola selenatireducens]
MSQSYTPLRSVLYAPGVNARALEKACSLPIDCLILDLEDAVAPEAKSEARDTVVKALTTGDCGYRKRVVRVNGLETQWGAGDIAAVARSGVDAVLLPKVESAEAVLEALEALDAAGAPAELPLWVMAETPRGILSIDQIAGAHPRLEVIVMGTSDLAKEMRVLHTPGREGLLTSLGLCVLAARAHGLEILDGVHLDLQDDNGFQVACEQGRNMGFDGKTLIHPRQIEMANRLFGVSDESLMQAQKIVTAWQQSSAEGKGVCVVDGRLVENLHVEEAKRVIAMQSAINGRD